MQRSPSNPILAQRVCECTISPYAWRASTFDHSENDPSWWLVRQISYWSRPTSRSNLHFWLSSIVRNQPSYICSNLGDRMAPEQMPSFSIPVCYVWHRGWPLTTPKVLCRKGLGPRKFPKPCSESWTSPCPETKNSKEACYPSIPEVVTNAFGNRHGESD